MGSDKHYKGLHHALAALKGLTPEEQKKLIAQIVLKEPELARQLQENLFEFNDIAYLSKIDFKFLWFEIPRNIWLLALRGGTTEIAIFIKSCLSLRAHTELVEDIKALGPQPAKMVLAAQKQVLDEIRSLAKKGRVIMPKKKK